MKKNENLITDAVEEQRVQAEERGNKLKQLLVKAKKDIADAKKLETEQRSSDAQLRGQTERLQQHVEELKVSLSFFSLLYTNVFHVSFAQQLCSCSHSLQQSFLLSTSPFCHTLQQRFSCLSLLQCFSCPLIYNSFYFNV